MPTPRIWVFALALLAMAAPLQAQEPLPGRPRLEELRRRVHERVAVRVQQELGLTNNQMVRLRTTVGTYAAERRQMEMRQRDLRESLTEQLRSGAAVRPDSVARLTDELMTLRVRYAESFRAEQTELARFLDPVQRAKLTLLRERLASRAQEFRRRRPFLER